MKNEMKMKILYYVSLLISTIFDVKYAGVSIILGNKNNILIMYYNNTL